MNNLTMSIPHRLGRDEARRRIEDEVGTVRREYGALLHNLDTTWDGDRLNFSLSALGQPISGHLLVEDQVVHVDVELPWLFAMLGGAVKHQVECHGHKLLSGPRSA